VVAPEITRAASPTLANDQPVAVTSTTRRTSPTISAIGLPSWLTRTDNHKGSGLSAKKEGSYAFTIKASCSPGSFTGSFVLTVT
jgi:hypothetical protein